MAVAFLTGLLDWGVFLARLIDLRTLDENTTPFVKRINGFLLIVIFLLVFLLVVIFFIFILIIVSVVVVFLVGGFSGGGVFLVVMSPSGHAEVFGLLCFVAALLTWWRFAFLLLEHFTAIVLVTETGPTSEPGVLTVLTQEVVTEESSGRCGLRAPKHCGHTLCSLDQAEDRNRRECSGAFFNGTPRPRRNHISPPPCPCLCYGHRGV
ncbi:hypothetical protein Baya_6588 [Bagarius yarrelli]|uniref:Uncharacterized protein n=1 Tax=Bagarius yarrelli TaxID=175774 RepID=A0A556U1A9_BAGYA|nr:hypothetical protein Baya_6588 [Bagarius yarrelli]